MSLLMVYDTERFFDPAAALYHSLTNAHHQTLRISCLPFSLTWIHKHFSLFIPLFLNFRVDLCEDNCVSHRAAVASPCCEVQAPRHLFEASITPLNTPRFSHKDTPVTGCYRNQCFFFWNFCWWHCSLRRVDGKCCWISCAI